ncbi:hypothetical protein PHSY_002707 [Pseudozyma hubeiensis SY62]|uniref:Uncharacterized protein n=1 Tax=Pseudozyma hubeiensis (strain SY62) TaxID=1305764 RepID=R9P1T9_PSEHS|nr:hypothetical protein PHSY_002707 [Pseudozyma hubeiensis SY62]GAC95132.1 hypothetical protein PHSY_002707 [Pseudozyma hubeiensis SY62]
MPSNDGHELRSLDCLSLIPTEAEGCNNYLVDNDVSTLLICKAQFNDAQGVPLGNHSAGSAVAVPRRSHKHRNEGSSGTCHESVIASTRRCLPAVPQD